MKLIGNNALCLLEKEFLIISAAIIELSEKYHKRQNLSENFYEKFGYSLQENDRLYEEFLSLRKKVSKEYEITFDGEKKNIFIKALEEITENFEDYEFQVITEFSEEDVMSVLSDLHHLKSEF